MVHMVNPNSNYDKKMFSKVVIFVGKDLVFSTSAITILLAKKVNIIAIVGETSDLIWGDLSSDLLKYNARIIRAKRPWEESDFTNLNFGNDTLGVNCGLEYIIPGSILDILPTINTHPAALPLNRGCHHSFWGIMEKTILGATLHWMTEGLDEGPIIAQKTFKDDGYMSAEVIQNESNFLCLELLDKNIDNILNGKSNSKLQNKGSYHSKKEIISASTLNTGNTIAVDYLFDLCRATNNKKNGFIIKKDNRKFKIIIENIEELL